MKVLYLRNTNNRNDKFPRRSLSRGDKKAHLNNLSNSTAKGFVHGNITKICRSAVGWQCETNIRTTIQNCGATVDWERLHQTPYSPDQAPSDFHLLPAFKTNLALEATVKSNKLLNVSSECKATSFPGGLFEAYEVV
ncbi:hypothetical protein TNCV_3281911 [Trichonephila clavipes]|nr:hypothetical protein TNCV_3281911 [Trichonephila clavipes]